MLMAGCRRTSSYVSQLKIKYEKKRINYLNMMHYEIKEENRTKKWPSKRV